MLAEGLRVTAARGQSRRQAERKEEEAVWRAKREVRTEVARGAALLPLLKSMATASSSVTDALSLDVWR